MFGASSLPAIAGRRPASVDRFFTPGPFAPSMVQANWETPSKITSQHLGRRKALNDPASVERIETQSAAVIEQKRASRCPRFALVSVGESMARNHAVGIRRCEVGSVRIAMIREVDRTGESRVYQAEVIGRTPCS